jgi:streptogramin lyase
MNRTHSTRHAWLLAVALLSGCQAAIPGAVGHADRKLTVTLAPTDKQVQAVAKRKMISDIDHYELELFHLAEGGMVSTGFKHTSSAAQGYTFTFEHLGPEYYIVKATGFDAANAPITTTAENAINLTGNDVETAPAALTLELYMLPSIFSGTLKMPSAADLPADATSLIVSVTDSNGTLMTSPTTFTPGQNVTVKNLRPNENFNINVKATHSDGKVSFAATSYVAQYDAYTPELEQDALASLAFGGKLTGFATYALGENAYERLAAIGPDQYVWSASIYGSSLQRVSPAGVVQSFNGFGYGFQDLAVDGDNNAWALQANDNRVRRTAPDGTITTFDIAVEGGYGTKLAVGGGHAWVIYNNTNQATHIAPDGTITHVDLTHPGYAVAVDADGNAWISCYNDMKAVHVTVADVVNVYDAGSYPEDIAVDSHGNAWVTNLYTHQVQRFAPDGTHAEFAVGYYPNVVFVDADDSVWVGHRWYGASIERITSAGARTDFPLGSDQIFATDIQSDQAGGVWLTSENKKAAYHVPATGAVGYFPVSGRVRGLATDTSGNAWLPVGSDMLKYTL